LLVEVVRHKAAAAQVDCCLQQEQLLMQEQL
jgi:hypothetical protein